jgi:hypothetical protein
MVTGRVPYLAETPMAVVVKHINDPMPPPRQVTPALPEAVERVVLKALAKRPEDRYATAGDMVQALRAAIPETVVGQSTPRGEDATIRSLAGPTFEDRDQEALETVVDRKPSRLSLIWILVVAAAAIVVIGAIVFFAFLGGQKVATEATEAAAVAVPEQTDTEVVQPAEAPTEVPLPPATPAPPTETTPPPTPAETAPPGPAEGPSPPAPAEQTDPTLVDNFNDPAFDGSINPDLWRVFDASGGGQIVQQNGILKASHGGQPERAIGLSALKYANKPIDTPTFFEAKLMVERSQEGQVYLFVGTDLSSEDYADCTLGYGETQASIYCNYFSRGETEFYQERFVDYGTWHTVRIEVEPATMTFTYYIDGQKVGSYISPNAEELKEAEFSLDVGVWGASSEPVIGYIDDVRIGEIEQPYDDFDDPAFDGARNPQLWETAVSPPSWIEQQNGAMVFTFLPGTPEDEAWLLPIGAEALTPDQFKFVEARLLLSSETIAGGYGDLNLGLTAPLSNERELFFDCFMAREEASAYVQCLVFTWDDINEDYQEEYSTEPIPTNFDVWRTVRIEIDSEVNATFYVDGQPVGSYRPGAVEEVKASTFQPGLWIYSEEQDSLTGSVDEVRIGQ